jgi:hypothetical protein
MTQGGRRNNTPKISVFPLFPYSLSLSFPLSFLEVGKEVRRGWWIVREDAGVQEGDLWL